MSDSTDFPVLDDLIRAIHRQVKTSIYHYISSSSAGKTQVGANSITLRDIDDIDKAAKATERELTNVIVNFLEANFKQIANAALADARQIKGRRKRTLETGRKEGTRIVKARADEVHAAWAELLHRFGLNEKTVVLVRLLINHNKKEGIKSPRGEWYSDRTLENFVYRLRSKESAPKTTAAEIDLSTNLA